MTFPLFCEALVYALDTCSPSWARTAFPAAPGAMWAAAFVGNIFVGSICIFPVFTGLAFFRGAWTVCGIRFIWIIGIFDIIMIIIIGICISVYACIRGYIHEDASFLQVIGVS